MNGIGRHGAAQIVERMVDRWPSDKWAKGSMMQDWIVWLEPLDIDQEAADACLRECKAEGLTAHYDNHIPKILERLKRCQNRRERVNRETGEVECGTCDGGRQVRVGDKLPLRYERCPTCQGSGSA